MNIKNLFAPVAKAASNAGDFGKRTFRQFSHALDA